MGRTINTTLTTLFTIGMVYILGVPSLKQFTLPLIVGILAGGIIVSGKLVNYRIEQLEKKVEKHNNLITRTFRLEQAVALLDERVRVANHRISDLEKEEVE